MQEAEVEILDDEYFYSQKLISAFIGSPFSEIFYKTAFHKIENSKMPYFATWSWWAFFGGIFFFIYRKLYLEAAIFLSLNLLVMSKGFSLGFFVIWILEGYLGAYFVYLRYKRKKQEVEMAYADEFSRVQAMRFLGGINMLAIPLAMFYYLFFFVTAVVSGFISIVHLFTASLSYI